MSAFELIETLDVHRFDEARLAAYLETTLAGFQKPLRVRQFGTGQSNPTFLIEAGSGGYVLRKKPPGQLLPRAHMIEREFRVLSALAETDVPIPKPLLLCEDPSIIGTAFYLMEYLPGRIFRDPRLPDVAVAKRAAIYDATTDALARLHQADWRAAGLSDFGKPADYIRRQIELWTKQYAASTTHTIEAMDRLIAWLPENIPDGGTTTIVHGDFHLQNLIFHETEARVIGIIDWELATLGEPLSDLAYNCMVFYLPARTVNLSGLADSDLAALGLPAERDYVAGYCRRTGRGSIENWPFYMAFAFFRCAAIAQGVYARAMQKIASAPNAIEVGKLATPLAEQGWLQAGRQDAG